MVRRRMQRKHLRGCFSSCRRAILFGSSILLLVMSSVPTTCCSSGLSFTLLCRRRREMKVQKLRRSCRLMQICFLSHRRQNLSVSRRGVSSFTFEVEISRIPVLLLVRFMSPRDSIYSCGKVSARNSLSLAIQQGGSCVVW